MTEAVNKAIRCLLMGEFLGSGACRSVYVYLPDPTKVIKIMDQPDSTFFQNQLEWEYWHDMPKPQRKWLAPCHGISDCGLALVQDRTSPLAEYTKLPKKIPTFLHDEHRSNFGMLKGKVVCHDYGLLNPTYSMRMRKANWRE